MDQGVRQLPVHVEPSFVNCGHFYFHDTKRYGETMSANPLHVVIVLTAILAPTHDGTSAGDEWVAKRWHSADVLLIRGKSRLLHTMAWQLHRGCTDLASVQSMLVDTYHGHEVYEACPKYMASLFYLLAHLTGLRKLNLQIYSMQLLTPLSGLKELHIIYNTPANAPGVQIEPDSLRSLLGCLKEMSGLERLSLDASPDSDQSGLHDMAWFDQWASFLDIEVLPNLTSVSLKCFASGGMFLPPACTLDLRICEEGSSIELRHWLFVQDNLVLFSLQDRDMNMSVVPDLLCEDLPRLNSVTFSVTKIGGGDAHLFPSHALMHVKALQMVASTIQLHIPADVAWKDARLEALDVLSITFEDVARFVRTIGRFQICYMNARGLFLADLLCEMGRQGLHWKATQCGARTTLYYNIAEGDTFGSMCPIELTCND